MHLSINITALSYDGNSALIFDAEVARSDNPSANRTNMIAESVQVGSSNEDFEHGSQMSVYRKIGEACYAALCDRLRLTADAVNYVFIGLAVVGPLKIPVSSTELVDGKLP